MDSVYIGDQIVDGIISENQSRFAIFELAYPFIYIPMNDFNLIAK